MVAGATGEASAYTLGDLQTYLQQFPAAHYSHNGRKPLLYATVLLLSLQFKAAVAFLAQDASTRDYRSDAVHLAIALIHHKVCTPAVSASCRLASWLQASWYLSLFFCCPSQFMHCSLCHRLCAQGV